MTISYLQESWEVKKHENGLDYDIGQVIVSENGCGIALISETNGPKNAKANAHLIAAAPDMFRALQKFIDVWGRTGQFEKTDVAYRRAKEVINNVQWGSHHD